MHEPNLILTVSASLLAALVFGFATHRLGLSPLVGYLLAGIAVGPHTPGFAGDQAIAAQLAEIGIILLMFGVGLHFDLRDLVAVKNIAVTGAVGQSLVATALGTALGVAAGWSLSAGVVLGLGISVASTVVLIRGLEENGIVDSSEGRIAIGWLVVEDIFTIVVLVLLPVLAQSAASNAVSLTSIAGAVVTAAAKFALFGAFLLIVGVRAIPWVVLQAARTRSRELFTLTVLVVALVVAVLSATVFGVSMALGAFVAGMVVGQSRVSHRAAADALPLRDAFAVLFFVSVGMLFDPAFVFERFGLVMGVLAIILVGKPLTAAAIVLLMGYTPRTALTVSVGLAQIGEFTFILAEAGHKLGVLPVEGQSALVAGALISNALNPLLFRALGPIERWLRSRRALWGIINRKAEARAQTVATLAAGQPEKDEAAVQAVVVGHGPVGRTVSRLLREFGVVPVVIDLNVDTVLALTARGERAVCGDASSPEILRAAGVERARYILITLPDLASRIPVIIVARELNAEIEIVVRARYLGERAMLEEVGATAVFYEEVEMAVALGKFLLRKSRVPEERIAREASGIRREFALGDAGPEQAEGAP